MSQATACAVCGGESLGAVIGPDGSLLPRRCGACADIVLLDPTDPQMWGAAVERMAAKMAARMWGVPAWYRGTANDALTAAFPGLDPKDTARVLHAYLDSEGQA
jgi:hypothetical protein